MFYLSDFIFGVILLSVRLFRKGIRPYVLAVVWARVLLLKHALRNPQIYISVTEPREPSQNSGAVVGNSVCQGIFTIRTNVASEMNECSLP